MSVRILERVQLSELVFKLVFEAPLIARKRKAGQFVILRIHEQGERVPLTIADADPEAGTVTVIFQAVGKSTRQLSELQAGDAILAIVNRGVRTDLRSADQFSRLVAGLEPSQAVTLLVQRGDTQTFVPVRTLER